MYFWFSAKSQHLWITNDVHSHHAHATHNPEWVSTFSQYQNHVSKSFQGRSIPGGRRLEKSSNHADTLFIFGQACVQMLRWVAVFENFKVVVGFEFDWKVWKWSKRRAN